MKRLLLTFATLVSVLFLTACSSALTAAVVTINGSHDALEKAHESLEYLDTTEQRDDVANATTRETGEAALVATRAKFAPLWAAYTRTRAAWLLAHVGVATAVAMDQANMRPDLSLMLQTLENLGSAWQDFQTLIGHTIQFSAARTRQ